MNRRRTTIGLALPILAGLVIFVGLHAPASKAASGVPFSAPQTGTIARSAGTIPYTRYQYGAAGSDSYLVWTEKDESQDPEKDDLVDTRDIAGMSIGTGLGVDAAVIPGNQTEPAISGSTVVWEDNARTCPICQNDILGKDLTSGITFTIATGPGDHSHPAIAGNTVAWVDSVSNTEQLRLKDISSETPPVVVTAVVVTNGLTLDRPVISSEYLVWDEMRDSTSSTPPQATLRVYDRSARVITDVVTLDVPTIPYAVADHRLVWADTQLHLLDLSTGQASVLFNGRAETLAISGSSVVWSAGSGVDSNGQDIWGAQITSTTSSVTPVLLVTGPGNQSSPVIAGDLLAWQNDGGPDDGQITAMSLSTAFASPPVPTPTDIAIPYPPPTDPPSTPWTPLPTAVPTDAPALTGSQQSSSDALTFTRPMYKGMHSANSTSGWGSDTAATDALVNRASSAPYFGAVTVIETDLGFSTNAPAPWGPRVSNLMSTLVNQNPPVEVIVRTHPPDRQIYQPDQDGSSTPAADSNLVINDLAWRSWMRRIQIENEPDAEWNAACVVEACGWPGGQWAIWSNRNDWRFYTEINYWYMAVRANIQNFINTCTTGDACVHLKTLPSAISIWAPPLNPGLTYAPLSDGTYSRYVPIRNMVNSYKCPYNSTSITCLSYHAYPAPSGRGPTNGIRNNSYDHFTWSLQQQVDSSYGGLHTRTQITEFGWDPTLMLPQHCDYHQYDRWTALYRDPSKQGECGAYGGDHVFENDISNFIHNWRHNADTVVVWIVRGWNSRADGVQNGAAEPWLSRYQQSAP